MGSVIINIEWLISKRMKGKVLVQEKRVTLEDIFNTHARDLMGYIRALTRDENHSEDILQEVFCRLAKYQEKIETIENIRAYLFEMARNESFRFMSKEKKFNEKKIALLEKPLIETKSDSISQKESMEDLNLALGLLPDEQREIVFLKCIEGFTFEEIAKLMQISNSTAASRYRYGIEKLRNIIGGQI